MTSLNVGWNALLVRPEGVGCVRQVIRRFLQFVNSGSE